jgi:hypothetical protein
MDLSTGSTTVIQLCKKDLRPPEEPHCPLQQLTTRTCNFETKELAKDSTNAIWRLHEAAGARASNSGCAYCNALDLSSAKP